MVGQKRKAVETEAAASISVSAPESTLKSKVKAPKSPARTGTRVSARLRGLAPTDATPVVSRATTAASSAVATAATSVAGDSVKSVKKAKSVASASQKSAVGDDSQTEFGVGDVIPELESVGSVDIVTSEDYDQFKAENKKKLEDEGEKDVRTTTLADLLSESKTGAVFFTYPKASTPGCTTQVKLFEPLYPRLKEAGYSLHGLSADSCRANATFAAKQGLTYPLLCDRERELISAFGLKKGGPGGTQRGVIVIDKEGKVSTFLKGGPRETAEAIERLLHQ